MSEQSSDRFARAEQRLDQEVGDVDAVGERDVLDEERLEAEEQAEISANHDPYRVIGEEEPDARVFTATGGDWSEIAEEATRR